MSLKHRQKLWHRVMLSWVTIIVLLLISILLTKSLWGIYNKNKQSNIRATQAKADLEKLTERKESLETNLANIKSTNGIEAELRDKFDVGKDGERLLVIIDKEIITQETQADVSWWGNLWQKLQQ
jgi:cell division protein FtsB